MTGWGVGLILFGLTVVSFHGRDTVPPRLSLRKTF